MNTLGHTLRFSCFGESHGPAIGGVLDGLPPRMHIDTDALASYMARRRPGLSPSVSPRREADEVKILSGLSEDGLTLGTPLAFIIENTDARPADYEHLRHTYRPGHADYTYEARYGIRDHRGGGHASGRLTAAWTAAGAIAMQWLEPQGISITARLISVGGSTWTAEAIEQARQHHDTVGGLVECVITGMPAGVGNPPFGKLQAALAHAMLSIGGVKGFEYGDGFEAARSRGSLSIDEFTMADGHVQTRTNHSGGIQGGISNGMPIVFRVAFKPTATMPLPVRTINDQGEEVSLTAGGRHDPCIAVRGRVVVEAMAALTVADAILSSPRP